LDRSFLLDTVRHISRYFKLSIKNIKREIKTQFVNNIYNFELLFALLPTAAQLLPVVATESAYMLVAGNNFFWALVLQIE